MRRGITGLILLLASTPYGLAADPPLPDSLRSFEQQMRKVIAAAEPSVVSIVVSHNLKYPPSPKGARGPGRLGSYPRSNDLGRQPRFSPPQPGFDPKLDLTDPQNVVDNHFGSGVVLDPDGTILTNYHLIDGATKIFVRSASGKGSYADVLAADARSDLAVLKLLDPISGLKPIRFAEVRVSDGVGGEKASVVRGSWVIALGHPHASGVGDGTPSASWGILSSVRRRAAGPGREEQRSRALYHHSMLLETDARIAVGSSGGVLLNLDGEAIGLITPLAAVAGSETAGGFALPFDANYKRIIKVLRKGEEVEFGFLGVSVDPAGSPRVDGGLSILQVTPHTPAALAGLRGLSNGGQDVIVAIDGVPIREQDDLFLLVGAALAGTRVTLTIANGERTHQVPVALAKNPHDLPWIASNRPPAVHGLRVEYSSVLLMQNVNAPRRGEVLIPSGVLVREIDPGSPAEAWFKKLGAGAGQWVITHVNDKAVTTPAEFYLEASRNPGKKLTLRVIDPKSPGTEHLLQLPDPPSPDRQP